MVAETSQTLDRGLTVLELLSDSSDGLTVTEIAARLGVSRTVVYRLVVTLEQHALLRVGAYLPLGQGVDTGWLARLTPAEVPLALTTLGARSEYGLSSYGVFLQLGLYFN